MKTIEIEVKEQKIKVLKSDMKAAQAAWKNGEKFLIVRPTYVIEIPSDDEMDDPINLILDGADYIYLVK